MNIIELPNVILFRIILPKIALTRSFKVYRIKHKNPIPIEISVLFLLMHLLKLQSFILLKSSSRLLTLLFLILPLLLSATARLSAFVFLLHQRFCFEWGGRAGGFLWI